MPLAILPIVRKASVMRARENRDHGVRNFVVDRVRKALHDAVMHTILVAGPDARANGQFVDRLQDFGAESVGSERATLSIPWKCFANVGLSLG